MENGADQQTSVGTKASRAPRDWPYERTRLFGKQGQGYLLEINRTSHGLSRTSTLHTHEWSLAFAITRRPPVGYVYRGPHGIIRGTIGDLAVLPSNHRIELFLPPGDDHFVHMQCLLDNAHFQIRSEHSLSDRLSSLLDLRNRAVRSQVSSMLREMWKPSMAAPLVLDASAVLLGQELGRVAQDKPSRNWKSGGLSPSKLRLIEERLRANLPAPSVSELSDIANLSVRHLSRSFQSQFGQAIREKIHDVRLQQAFDLLLHTDQPIGIIASLLGFSNSTGFGLAFRRGTGLSPSDIRSR